MIEIYLNWKMYWYIGNKTGEWKASEKKITEGPSVYSINNVLCTFISLIIS